MGRCVQKCGNVCPEIKRVLAKLRTAHVGGNASACPRGGSRSTRVNREYPDRNRVIAKLRPALEGGNGSGCPRGCPRAPPVNRGLMLCGKVCPKINRVIAKLRPARGSCRYLGFRGTYGGKVSPTWIHFSLVSTFTWGLVDWKLVVNSGLQEADHPFQWGTTP